MSSAYKGNRACDCHCCPAYTAFDPSQLDPANVSYVGTSDPAEVSDGHARAVIYERVTESALTTEDVIKGAATGTVTVAAEGIGADHPGSRRVTIDVTTTDAPWVAGVILWDDSGYEYDPQEKGSISRIRAVLASRWYDENNRLTQSFGSGETLGQPWPIFGVAIEQDGETFLSYEHDETAFRDDQCWTQRTGGAYDGSGAQYVGRLPYNGEESDGTGAIPDREAAGGFRLGRCDDRLVKIGSNGEFELGTVGSRPDISYDAATSRPVTKFGIFVGLMSEEASTDYTAAANLRAAAGSYEYDIIIDDLWLDVASWGVPKVFDADVGSTPNFGTTYIDDALTSIPAWTASSTAVALPGGGVESCLGGGVAALIDGLVGNQTTSAGEYTALRLSTAPTVPAVTDSGTITVEFEWHTIDERDHVKPTGDADDTNLSRTLWSGVWISNACRFLAEKEGDLDDHGCGNMRWEMQGYISSTGERLAADAVASTYGGDDYEYDTVEKYSGKANGDNCGGTLQKNRAAPMDGDRVVIMLRRKYTNAEATALNATYIQNVADGVYDQPPQDLAYPEAHWQAFVWVHGRVLLMGVEELGNFTLGETAGDFVWFGGSGAGPLTVGLLGMCGGRWGDLRLKVRA